MFRFRRAHICLVAATLLVVFLSALLGPLLALVTVGRPGTAAGHLHLPGMPQAHHHHEEEDNRLDNAVARRGVLLTKSPLSHRSYPGSDEQQLTGVSPLAKLLAGQTAAAMLGLPPVPNYLFRPSPAWGNMPTVPLQRPGQLKPKIPDLRIFLGSLTV